MSENIQKENPVEGLSQKTHRSLALAITRTTLKLPSLKKDNRNSHGGYNFVSIDDYYATVAKAAAEEGITWTIREESVGEIMSVGAKGSLVIRFTFAADVYFDGMIYNNFWKGSLFHPYTGAQTSGSAMSYADKMFQRTTFKVQTGEGDADSAAPIDTSADDLLGESRPTPKPITRPFKGMTDEQLRAVKNMTVEALALAKTDDQLSRLWTDNEPTYKGVEETSKQAYAELVSIFKTRKLEIKKEAAGG
jgi:hypothetical protein